MADVTVIAPVSIQGDSTKVVARAHTILNGAKVCTTTNRDLISAEAKLGGFLVYNTTTSQLEWWNGSSWVAVTGSGGGGGGMGFRFTYSVTTTDADPGAGTLRGNNAALASVTQLYVDLAEYGGTDVTAWLDSLDDYPGTIKGIVRLSSQSDPTKWIEYVVTAWTTATGYRKLTVTYKDGPGGLLTTAGDTFLAFDYATSGQVLRDGSLPLTATWAVGNQGLTGVKGVAYDSEIATTGATPAVNFTTGDLQKTTLTANCAPVFTAPAGVGWIQWHVIQDSTPRTITFPGSVLGTPPQPATASGAHTFYNFFWDGTNYHYGGLSHAALSDLTTGDPHTQYSLVTGTRAFTGAVTITQAALATGSPYAFKVAGGAHTALTSSTEAPDVDLNLARTVQFATGALATQRAMVVRAPTYGFVGASVLSDAATLAISGGPVAGTNATITRRWALWVQGQDTRLDGNLQLGSGTYPAGADGLLRIPYGGIFKGTTADGVGQQKILEWGLGGVSQNLAIGDGVNTSTLIYGGSLSFYNGSTEKMRIVGTVVTLFSVNSFVFASAGVTAPVFGMADDVAATTTAQPVTYKGQDATGTTAVTAGKTIVRGGNATGGSGTRNGGDLELTAGSGATANGEVSLKGGGGTKQIRINTTGIGFYTAAPAAKPTITGSRGANAALADLLTQLATLGLLTDSST